MTDTEIFGDAEHAILEYVRSTVTGLKCGVELPPKEKYDPRVGAPYLVVSRIGGWFEQPAYDAARLDLEFYGSDRQEVGRVAQQTLAAISRAHRAPGVFGGSIFYGTTIELGLSYNPDPVTDAVRWLATVVVLCRPINEGD